ncbi:MAG: hypothetical protein AAF740_01805 [Bacteroidota bacterium]
MKKLGFLKGLVTLTSGLIGVAVILRFALPNFLHPHTFYVIAFCSGITFLTFLLTTRHVGTKDFPNAVLGATAIRLFASATALVIYLYNTPDDRVRFIITFFIVYFLFVGFEIRVLLHTLRRRK